jgi:hypothetical protein
MADPDRLSVDLILCDWAEVLNGKLYLQGAGWGRVPPGSPVGIAIAALVHVPYTETNKKHDVSIVLTTEDGTPYPAESPFEMAAQFELGRPPGMRPGEGSIVPMAAKLLGVAFEPGGYYFAAIVGDAEAARVSFVSREN